MMVNNIIYTGPNDLLPAEDRTKVIYTNSYYKETNLKYCLLRSGVVILGEDSTKEKIFCDWYGIDTQEVNTFDMPQDVTKISLVGKFSRGDLNTLFILLSKVKKDLTIYSTDPDSPASKIAKALIRRKI
jgi:hypothetical protein|tara:strand:- start:546 stop:932 length:387 start_codon:yes stop_codon:yes gene_type:complete